MTIVLFPTMKNDTHTYVINVILTRIIVLSNPITTILISVLFVYLNSIRLPRPCVFKFFVSKSSKVEREAPLVKYCSKKSSNNCQEEEVVV